MQTRKMKWTFLFSLVLFVVMVTSAMASGQIWPVSTSLELYEAQRDACDGDTIVLYPGIYAGIYYEDIWKYPINPPQGKDITFRSVNQNDPGYDPSYDYVANTIIYGYRYAEWYNPRILYEFCCYFNGGESQLIGLTIMCGFMKESYLDPPIHQMNPSIYCEGGASPTISKCKFVGGTAPYPVNERGGGDVPGIWCNNSSPVIEDCTISIPRLCPDYGTGAVSIFGNSNVTIKGSNISNNRVRPDLSDLSVNAIELYGGNLTVEDCTISGNEGTGIFAEIWGTGDVTISNSTIDGEIDGEKVSQGLYLANSGKITITGSTIRNNYCETDGGGIFIYNQGNVLIDDCKLTDNTAGSSGGAIWIHGCATGIINKCTITGNEGGEGGGIYIHGDAQNVTISNCEIKDNKTGIEGDGGGIWNAGGGTTVTHCKITGNQALNPPDGYHGRGGGIFSAGDIIDIINCEITGNYAEGDAYGDGGGIYIHYSTYYGCPKKIYNCTIAGNSASHYGGAYLASEVDIDNCIFWGNLPDEQQIKNIFWSDSNISHCDIQHSKSVPYQGIQYIVDLNFDLPPYTPTYPNEECILGKDIVVNSNIAEDPQFIAGYHLRSGSPCIDKGDNSVVNWPYDIDGDTRIINGTVDIGADEVDYLDYLDLVSWWKFDEGIGTTAYDSVGANNGTIYGAAWTIGKIDGALSFDGSYDYVMVGDKDNLEQQEFTLSFWARLNNPSGSLQGGIAKGYIFGAAGEYSYMLDFSGGLTYACITNTSNVGFGVTGSIVDSSWHMWSMTVGGGTLTLYKDGTFANSIGYTGIIDYTKTRNNFVIGARDSGSYAFNGKIDDVRFYDRVLLASEIGQLYQKGLGPKAFAPNPADGATGVDPDTALSWSPGGYALSHDVYFGATNPPTYIGERTDTTYAPGTLNYDTTYYWRIDEKNPAGTVTGDVWSFKTHPMAIVITNVYELQAVRNDLGGWYELGNNINASETQNWNGGAGFEPIGNSANNFTGTFDGKGHVITGLYINRPSTDGVGLFGYISGGAEIKNVGLSGVNVTARMNSGSLVGQSSGAAVRNSWSAGAVRGSYSGQMRLGGLIGVSVGANTFVSKCFSSATVIASGGAQQVGGLAGYNGHGSVMSDCYATGAVTGSSKVGGLVGDNCYPEGGYVKRCYSVGKVTGTGGGLIGYNCNGGVTYDSYWDTQTSGKSSSYGGIGKTTAQMKQKATFVNWDFVNVWDIIESYPFLRTGE